MKAEGARAYSMLMKEDGLSPLWRSDRVPAACSAGPAAQCRTLPPSSRDLAVSPHVTWPSVLT